MLFCSFTKIKSTYENQYRLVGRVGEYDVATKVIPSFRHLHIYGHTTIYKSHASENSIHKKVIMYSVGLTFLAWVFFCLLITPVVSFAYPASYGKVSLWASLLALGMAIHGLGDMFNRFLGAHAQGISLRNGAIISGVVLLSGNILLVWLWGLSGAVLTRILGSLASCGSMVYYYIKFVRNSRLG